jgi:hypothetical protein
MKSTYKLLGLLWDGKPVSQVDSHRCFLEEHFLDYAAPLNLFDIIEGKKRSILLSTVLTKENAEDLENLFLLLEDCNQLEIIQDYGRLNNKVIDAFIYKKEAQVHKFAETRLPDTKIVAVEPFSRSKRDAYD